LETAKGTLGAMDRALPLEQRQQGVALAAELEALAAATRTTQLAAVGLGDNGKPAPRVAVAPAAKSPPPLKPKPVTAGADFAKPVVLAAPPVKPASPAAKTASPPPTITGNWRVQLGAFGVAGNAQALWAKLKGHAALSGRQAHFVQAGKLTKLQAGPFTTRAEALAACAKLAGQACIPVQG
jgi:cell division septation protein DedD